MASFKSTIITQKGHNLIAKLSAGTATMSFTKIKSSDHDYSALTSSQLEALVSIDNIKQEVLVNEVTRINDASVKVSGSILNTSLTTGYYIKTIALYADDPDEGEILYSITVANESDWMPPYNNVSSASILIDLITVVSNAENVTIDVDPNAIVTITQFNEFKENVNTQLSENTQYINNLINQNILVSRHLFTGRAIANNKAFNSLVLGDSIASYTGATDYSTSWNWLLTWYLKHLENGTYDQSAFKTHDCGVGGQKIDCIVQYLANDVNSKRALKSFAYNYPVWLFMTGRNDYSGLSKTDFETLYRIAVRIGISNGIDVFCCTEPPKINMTDGTIIDGSSTTENYPDYVEIIKRVAESEGASYIDIYQYMKNLYISGTDLRTYMSSDGVHPNDVGHDLIANLISQCMALPDSQINKNINNPYENDIYKLIPQVYFTPDILTNAVSETITGSNTTARKEHTGTLDSIHISSGGSISYNITTAKCEYIIVTVMQKLSTGTVSIQCPSGVNALSNVVIPSQYAREYCLLFKLNQSSSSLARSVVISANGGDVYLNNITIIAPTLITKHTKLDNFTKTGTWAYETIGGASFLSSTTVGDTITLKWFGNEIFFNIALGSSMGIVNIKTDGVDNIIDLYITSSYYIGGYRPNTSGRLALGWHTTQIIVLTKNPSSSWNRVAIGEVLIYSRKNNDNTLVSNIDNYSEVYLDNIKQNYVRSLDANISITNNVVTTTTSTINTIETALK